MKPVPDVQREEQLITNYYIVARIWVKAKRNPLYNHHKSSVYIKHDRFPITVVYQNWVKGVCNETIHNATMLCNASVIYCKFIFYPVCFLLTCATTFKLKWFVLFCVKTIMTGFVTHVVTTYFCSGKFLAIF